MLGSALFYLWNGLPPESKVAIVSSMTFWQFLNFRNSCLAIRLFSDQNQKVIAQATVRPAYSGRLTLSVEASTSTPPPWACSRSSTSSIGASIRGCEAYHLRCSMAYLLPEIQGPSCSGCSQYDSHKNHPVCYSARSLLRAVSGQPCRAPLR